MQARTVWCSKWLGLLCIVLLPLIVIVWLSSYGESFFSLTRRLPAEVLVVEGWIGSDGIRAAATEFEQRGYRYIVATGGLTEEQHGQDPPNYPEIAEQKLVQFGIPKDKIITAPIEEIEHERTYKSAVAAWQALRRRGLCTRTVNIFTLGPHARRSRLVFAKVYYPESQVGVVAWIPSAYEAKPWWSSQARAMCLLKEIVGYPFELLLNSGRSSNSPREVAPPNSV